MKKIVLIGSTLTGNKGASAMAESAIQNLSKKFDEVEFSLLSYYPNEDKLINPYNNLKILNASPIYLGLVINTAAMICMIFPFLKSRICNLIPEIKAIIESDIILDQGGITFSDGREKFLIFNIATILPAIFLNKKIVKCGQALGPFNGLINKKLAKIFLPKITLILARGEYSYKNLKSIGLSDNVIQSTDYAFSLRIEKDNINNGKLHNARDFLNKVGKNKVVGICPSIVIGKKISDDHYEEINANFIDEYLIKKRGYKVILIPHSVRINTSKTHNNDLPLSKKIYDKLSARGKQDCFFIDSEYSSQELRYIIGKLDFFVASRFHSMISSLAMKIPTIVIGWSHKYEEVLKEFELEKYAFDYKLLNVDFLIKKFEHLEENEKTIKNLLNKNIKRVIEKSKAQGDYIVDIVN